MRTLLPMWGDRRMCFQSFHKVCMRTNKSYLRGKWNVHTSATSEDFRQNRSHGSNRNQTDILWTLMDWLLYQKHHLLERACQFFYNTMASCLHSHICYCFYRHISKLLQFEGFNSLSCFGYPWIHAKAMSTRGFTQWCHALANRAFFSSSTCESGGFSPSIVPWLKLY